MISVTYFALENIVMSKMLFTVTYAKRFCEILATK